MCSGSENLAVITEGNDGLIKMGEESIIEKRLHIDVLKKQWHNKVDGVCVEKAVVLRHNI